MSKWMLLSKEGPVCPDCLTEDDIVANRTGEFWLNSITGETHIA